MPPLQLSSVSIPSIVEDMVTIEIKDNGLADADIHYAITDEGEHICRKGHFRGLRVQLRIAHLKDGIYRFMLRSTENDNCIFSIRKTTGSFIEVNTTLS